MLTVWDEQNQASPKSWVHALLGKISCLSQQLDNELWLIDH
jgi:hypothetical protein